MFKKPLTIRIISFIVLVTFLFSSTTLCAYPGSKDTLRVSSSFQDRENLIRVKQALLELSNEGVGKVIREDLETSSTGIPFPADAKEEEKERIRAERRERVKGFPKVDGSYFGLEGEFTVIPINDLFRRTANMANIGLSDSYGETVIYMDMDLYNAFFGKDRGKSLDNQASEVAKNHELKTIALYKQAVEEGRFEGRFRGVKTVVELHNVDSLGELRKWMRENPRDAYVLNEMIHDKANRTKGCDVRPFYENREFIEGRVDISSLNMLRNEFPLWQKGDAIPAEHTPSVAASDPLDDTERIIAGVGRYREEEQAGVGVHYDSRMSRLVDETDISQRMEISQTVNPKGDDLIGMYLGTAGDVVGYFGSTNAAGGIYVCMDPFRGKCARFSAEDAEIYRNSKKSIGCLLDEVIDGFVARGYGIEAHIRCEVEDIGARALRITELEEGIFRIDFEWGYIGQPLRQRFIVYVEENVQDFLEDENGRYRRLVEGITDSGADFLMVKQSGLEFLAFQLKPFLVEDPIAILPFSQGAAKRGSKPVNEIKTSYWEEERLERLQLLDDIDNLGKAGIERIRVIKGTRWGLSGEEVAIYRLHDISKPVQYQNLTSSLLARSFFSIANSSLTHTRFAAVELPRELAHDIMALRPEDLKDAPAWVKATYLRTRGMIDLLEGDTSVAEILDVVEEKKDTGANFILSGCLIDPRDEVIQALMRRDPTELSDKEVVLRARIANRDYQAVDGKILADPEMINLICGARTRANDLPVAYIEEAVWDMDEGPQELREAVLDELEFGQMSIEGDRVVLPDGREVAKEDCCLVFCGGGDCAGLNTAIAELAVQLAAEGKYLIGVRRGFSGACEEELGPELVYISPEIAEEIRYWPSTVLMSSRKNPFKQGEEEAKARLAHSLEGFGGVFITGGDDHGKMASEVYHELGIPAIWIPKSIDNDADTLMIGFQSALDIGRRVAIEAAYNAYTQREAEGTRVFVLESMGRGAGHLAHGIGRKDLAPEDLPEDLREHYEAIKGTLMVLVPEEPVTIQQIIDRAWDIYEDHGFVTIVVAEGFTLSQEDRDLAKLLEDPVLFARFCKMLKDDPRAEGLLDDHDRLTAHLDKVVGKDPHGHPKLGGVRHYVKGILGNPGLGNFEGIKCAELGFIMRGVAVSDPDEIELAEIYAEKAVELWEQGIGGVGVTLKDGEEITINNVVARKIEDVLGTAKEPKNKVLTGLYTREQLADAGVVMRPESLSSYTGSGDTAIQEALDEGRVMQGPAADGFPFKTKRVPVMSSVEEMQDFVHSWKEKGYRFCTYLAYKDEYGWENSTSRRYMNKVLPGFIYLPINIKGGDDDELERFYAACAEEDAIVAINQTQPHKSNPIVKRLFGDRCVNIDTLVKDEANRLVPYSLNGDAFTSWFLDEVGSYEDKTIVLLGVGGAGEPIARNIINYNPRNMYLIDIMSKKALSSELGENVHYGEHITAVPSEVDNIIFIFTIGKEFEDCSVFLEKYIDKGYIFVDIRPHMVLDTVTRAEELGWIAYTGNGMNARNDYVLLMKIAQKMGIQNPSFEGFKQKVDEDSFLSTIEPTLSLTAQINAGAASFTESQALVELNGEVLQARAYAATKEEPILNEGGFRVVRFYRDGYAIYRLMDLESNSYIDVAEKGATVMSFNVDGRETLLPSNNMVKLRGIPYMSPPNRVAGGVINIDGHEVDLHGIEEITGDGAGNLIHGPFRNMIWTVEEIGSDEDGVFIAWKVDTIDTQVGEAFGNAEHRLVYRLNGNKLSKKRGFLNKDTRPVKDAFAFHDWGFVSSASNAKVVLPAKKYCRVVDKLPTGELGDVGEIAPLEHGRVVSLDEVDAEIDVVLADLESDPDGWVTSLLYDSQDGTLMRFRQDGKVMKYIVFYVREEGRFVCIEAQSCMTDAHNLEAEGIEADLIEVGPGEYIETEATLEIENIGPGQTAERIEQEYTFPHRSVGAAATRPEEDLTVEEAYRILGGVDSAFGGVTGDDMRRLVDEGDFRAHQRRILESVIGAAEQAGQIRPGRRREEGVGTTGTESVFTNRAEREQEAIRIFEEVPNVVITLDGEVVEDKEARESLINQVESGQLDVIAITYDEHGTAGEIDTYYLDLIERSLPSLESLPAAVALVSSLGAAGYEPTLIELELAADEAEAALAEARRKADREKADIPRDLRKKARSRRVKQIERDCNIAQLMADANGAKRQYHRALAEARDNDGSSLGAAKTLFEKGRRAKAALAQAGGREGLDDAEPDEQPSAHPIIMVGVTPYTAIELKQIDGGLDAGRYADEDIDTYRMAQTLAIGESYFAKKIFGRLNSVAQDRISGILAQIKQETRDSTILTAQINARLKTHQEAFSETKAHPVLFDGEARIFNRRNGLGLEKAVKEFCNTELCPGNLAGNEVPVVVVMTQKQEQELMEYIGNRVVILNLETLGTRARENPEQYKETYEYFMVLFGREYYKKNAVFGEGLRFGEEDRLIELRRHLDNA